MDGTCSTHGTCEMRTEFFVVKSEGKRPFGRARRRLERNIRLDCREIWWRIVN